MQIQKPKLQQFIIPKSPKFPNELISYKDVKP